MIGYGDEDDHFVMELTYNYNVGRYDVGDDFEFIEIHSKDAVSNAKKSLGLKVNQLDGKTVIESPDGYKFHLVDEHSKGGNRK